MHESGRHHIPDDLRITIDPEASEEEVDKFVYSLALAIVAVARHLVDEKRRADGDLPTIDL